MVLWGTCAWINIQAQALQRVIKKSLTNPYMRFPVTHAVVERDNLLLRIRKPGVWSNLQRDLLLPILVFACVSFAGFRGPRL